MTPELIQERIQSIFRKVFDLDDLEIHRGMTASDVEGWDSMNHVHLVMAIEREFKLKFQASEILKLKNVGDMLDLVQSKTKA